MGMERSDNNFLVAVALIVAGAFIFSGAFIYLVSSILERSAALWVLAIYGCMLVITAFSVKNKETLGAKVYGYIITAYVTLMAGSFYFLQEGIDSISSRVVLVVIYAVPLVFLAQAWISGKKHHIY